MFVLRHIPFRSDFFSMAKYTRLLLKRANGTMYFADGKSAYSNHSDLNSVAFFFYYFQFTYIPSSFDDLSILYCNCSKCTFILKYFKFASISIYLQTLHVCMRNCVCFSQLTFSNVSRVCEMRAYFHHTKNRYMASFIVFL